MSALFFDIDNTLLSHRTFTVPKSAETALWEAKRNGHFLFLASGRNISGMKEYYDPDLFDGMVSSSGGLGMFHGEVIYSHPMDLADIVRIIFLAREYGTGLFMQAKDSNWMNPPGYARMLRYLKNDEEALNKRGIQMIQEYRGEPVLKMDLFFTESSRADRILDVLPEGVEKCVTLSEIPEQAGCEVTRKGITKGTGVREMMEYLGKDIRDSYGFGDSENDLAMLKECGTGIAMGNAMELVRREADYVTADIEEDGIYQAMKHFGLF